jgi:hypothetical protein
MLFWILLGLACIIPSAIYMGLRYVRGDAHKDTVITKFLDWPLVITGILLMVPGYIWIDVTVGLVAMIAWEIYGWVTARRKREELALERELGQKTEGDVA